MKRYFSIIGLFFTLLFQVSILPHFFARGWLPNIILVIIFCWCLLDDYREALFWAIGGGVLLDIFSSVNFSVNLISFLVAVLILYLLLHSVLIFDKYYFRILLFVIISLSYYGLVFIISWLFYFIQLSGSKIDYSTLVLATVLMITVANTLFMLLAYPLTSKYKDFIEKFTARLESKI